MVKEKLFTGWHGIKFWTYSWARPCECDGSFIGLVQELVGGPLRCAFSTTTIQGIRKQKRPSLLEQSVHLLD